MTPTMKNIRKVEAELEKCQIEFENLEIARIRNEQKVRKIRVQLQELYAARNLLLNA